MAIKHHCVEVIYDHTSTEINEELTQRIKQRFPNAEFYITPDYVLDPEAADPNVIVWEARVFIPTEVPEILVAFLEVENAKYLEGLPFEFTENAVADLDTLRAYQKLYSYWKR
jgi:hypothetical protein